MKTFILSITLILWFLITGVLALSIIGWVLIMPIPNNTFYHMSLDNRRSTWMTIGLDIKNKLLRD